ncbi:MAG: DUF4340 domain-containing protein [Phycisphaerales bacterium]|nr:DUF4340 domain-containing protein [Phycisphaerales bacterium]
MQSKRILVMLAASASALVLIAMLMRGGGVLGGGAGGDGAGSGGAGGAGGAGAGGASSADLLVDLAPMAERINVLVVESSEGTTRLEKRDGTWVVATRDGFPAQTESVVGALRGLAGLRKSQKLTAKPERHGDLGLAWPDSTGEAKLVSVYAGDEKPVAQVVVGRGVFQPDGVYARLLSEPQTWRCAGSMTVAATAQTWLANPVADISAGSIETISGCDPSGRTITLVRDDKRVWQVQGAEGGAAGAAAAGADGAAPGVTPGAPTDPVADGFKAAIPSLVVGMQAEDVRRATPEDAARQGVVTVTYGIGSGGTAHARLWRDGETYFVMLDAALPEPPAPSAASAPAAGSEAAPAAPTTDAPVEKSSAEDSTTTPQDPHAAIRTQAAAWDGWVFTVPSWRANQFAKLFGVDTGPASPPSGLSLPGGMPPMMMPPPGVTP